MSQNDTTNKIATYVGDREIVITRLLNVSREIVFEAWTKEELLAQWWGPQGFSITTKTFDLRPGGTWEFIMHGPDGVDYPNTNNFAEIVHPERIIIKHAVFPHFQATATFEDVDGQTKLTYSSVFEESTDTFNKVKEYAVPGGEQTMDRLEELLANLA